MSIVKLSHREACIKAIQEIVAYPSVLNEGENGTPFGQAIQDVLEATLERCQSLGFSTYLDPEGYYGYAEIGEGQESLAILCHLDVVPEGDLSLWETPPFEAVVRDGAIYGRGTQDDKGPSMAALYAVKALMDAGYHFNKRIRFIFGTDEETLWRCLARYGELEEVATMGFAPDSSFPLTFAEKGLLQANLEGSGHDGLSLEVGKAYNVVPARADYKGPWLNQVKEKLDALGYHYEVDGECLTVLGLAKHAKDAALGVNALVRLSEALQEFVDVPALNFIVNEIGHDATAKDLIGDISDEASGDLAFNIAGLTLTPEKSQVRLDIRIPVLADKGLLVEKLSHAAQKYGLTYQEHDYLAPLYVPLDSELVSTLMTVYREKTGDMSEPMSSGGATFARTMPNCVAFGAVLPESPSTEHMENEHMLLSNIYEAMEIYAEAVYRLAVK
ncbi:dipeptidase [Streptococcus merionis]|uniref:ArcT n=1 Tax=Streptococcus merionis TaxID=400065 RepID=A0A239SQM3_9STRE|nr:dipeptidase [Streptococcus merionis]SNU87765.1 ArcT [Streptococcus merionis]